MLCEDFASLLGNSEKRGDAGRFGAWTKLLNRLEAFSEASQRCARGLQKVSAGIPGAVARIASGLDELRRSRF